jgi:hypothetical protein
MTGSGSASTLHPIDAPDPVAPIERRHEMPSNPSDFDPAPPLEPTTVEPLTPNEAAVSMADTAPAPDAMAFSDRTPGPSKLRIGAVSGAGLALVVGAVATAFAASPAPSSPGTTNGSTSGAGQIVVTDPALDEGVELDHGRFGAQGFRDITITAISGTNLTLGTEDGWTRTIAVTDAVELTKGGQPVALSDLAIGDQVRFSQTRSADGTYTVEAIAVVVPSVGGVVSEVSATGFKVTTRDGSIWTIALDGSTTYQYGTGTGTLADVTNGTNVLVQGTSTGDNALTALSVRVAGDRAVGTVTAKTADTITLKKRDGSTVTIHVDADTTYRVAGVDTATLNNVAVDMGIGVSGRARADGSIDADAIVAGDGRGGFGGRGGPGGLKGGRFDGLSPVDPVPPQG